MANLERSRENQNNKEGETKPLHVLNSQEKLKKELESQQEKQATQHKSSDTGKPEDTSTRKLENTSGTSNFGDDWVEAQKSGFLDRFRTSSDKARSVLGEIQDNNQQRKDLKRPFDASETDIDPKEQKRIRTRVADGRYRLML